MNEWNKINTDYKMRAIVIAFIARIGKIDKNIKNISRLHNLTNERVRVGLLIFYL